MPSRRHLLAALGTAAAGSLAGCSGSNSDSEAADAASTNLDWPTARHDAANTGYAPGAAPVRDPEVTWRTEIGMASAPPVAADGRVFVPAGDRLLVLDADSGDERWRVDNGGGASVWAPPTVADGVAYLGDGDRQVRAFDAETGDLLWRFPTEGGVYAAPTPVQGRLIFGTNGERIYALDTETGEERWRREVFGGVSTAVAARPPHVYAATEAGEVYALTLYGEGAWRRRLPDAVECPPTVTGETVYVGCNDGTVHALRAHRSGRTRWHTDVGGFPRGLSVARDRVYVVGGRFRALGADGGRKRWSVLSGDAAAGLPAVAGDAVYVGTESGRLHAYKLDGGVGVAGFRLEPDRWSLQLGGSVQRGLAAADRRVYVPVRTGDERTELVAVEDAAQ